MKHTKILTLFLLSVAAIGAMEKGKEKLVTHPPKRTPPMRPKKSYSTSMISRYKPKDEVDLSDNDPETLKKELIRLRWAELKIKKEERDLKRKEMAWKKKIFEFAKSQAQEGKDVFFTYRDEVMLDIVPSYKKS